VFIDEDQSLEASIEVDVDWAPAYELLLSMSTFLNIDRAGHSLIEMGQPWANTVREQLPPDVVPRLTRKSVGRNFKEHDADLLFLLVQGSPGRRDAPTFLEWFSQLTAGAAYEAIAPRMAEPGPRMPRDFVSWRDPIAERLAIWHAYYF